MAEQLSKEQILLLNNLMYMTNKAKGSGMDSITAFEGKTIREIVNGINTGKLDDTADYGSYMTGSDWKNLIRAIQSDEQLMNVQVMQTYTDTGETGGGGVSTLFVDPANNEAVVCYRGTAANEWKDNFIGGAATDTADGVSTDNQMNALDWYRSLELDGYDTVTVTGHSKGGNKAKYVTIMDDSVDRCLSFDGQGFSDEFIDKYADKIAENQGKIENHNVGDDYVNLLLNDVGETHFYKGYDLGERGYLENHAPNTFLQFHEDGSVTMTPGSRSETMTDVDRFFNSYLRTLTPEEKQGTLELIGTLVEKGINGAKLTKILKAALKGENSEYFADLLAYLIKYDQANPGFINELLALLWSMGFEKEALVIRCVVTVIGWKKDAADRVLVGLLDLRLKREGIALTAEQIRMLNDTLHKVNTRVDQVNVRRNGEDKKVSSVKRIDYFGSGAAARFQVNPSVLKERAAEMSDYAAVLTAAAEELKALGNGLEDALRLVKPVIRRLEQDIEGQKSSMEALGSVLERISAEYSAAENKLAGMLNT